MFPTLKHWKQHERDWLIIQHLISPYPPPENYPPLPDPDIYEKTTKTTKQRRNTST
jgi:hypothetical protein